MVSAPPLKTSTFNLNYSDYVVKSDGTGNYKTINAAINAAGDHEGPQMVLIGPGVYTEDLVLKYNVSLVSLSTPTTIINLENEGSDLVPDTAETIIKGNHIVQYSTNPHIITLKNIRFESNDVGAPIIYFHNLDVYPVEEVYGSVFKFKNCTLSQFEVGAPSIYQIMSCPSTTMFGGLQCELEECTIFMATPSMFILESATGGSRHSNIFTFKNSMFFNAVEGGQSNFDIADSSLTLIGCNFYTTSLFSIYSTNSDCNLRIEDSKIVGYGEVFRDNSEGAGQTNISIINSFLSNRDVDGYDLPIFKALNKTMNVTLTDCTILNSPTQLGDGYTDLSISNTINTNGLGLLPTLTSPGGVTGQTLKFLDPTKQAIIIGPDATNDYPNSQRLNIQGTNGFYTGDGGGGEIYLRTGDGAYGNGNGGDMRIDCGMGYGTGAGGELWLEGGLGGQGGTPGEGGAGGWANIVAGNSISGHGGWARIMSGFGDTANGKFNGRIDFIVRAPGSGNNKNWQLTDTGELLYPGYYNSQSYDKPNGSVIVGDSATATAWTNNQNASTAKIIIQGQWWDGAAWKIHSCEVLVIREINTNVVNHITYGTVYTGTTPLFTLSSSVVYDMTILSITNLNTSNLYISTFVTIVGTYD